MFKLFSLFMVVAVNPGAADCNKNQTCFQQGRATKMMQKTKHKLLDSQVQIDEKTQTTLEALEVLKMQMVEKVPWTKEDKQKFSAALQELNTSFTQALQAEHDADESEWKAEKTKQETCHSEAAKRFQNVVAINNGNVADLREKHKRCRKVGKSWSEYENTATTCKSASSVTLPTNSCPDDIKDKIVIVQTDQAAYRNAKPKTEDGEANPSTCIPDQRAFEESFCLWRSSHHYACLAEETCVTTIDLPTTKQRLQQRSESRRGVTTSTRITFCKMEHLVEHGTANGTTNTDNCDGLVLPTDYLRLNLVVPVTKHCTTSSKAEYSTYPSSSDTAMCADWKSAEYSSWAAESYVIPDACHGTCSVDPVSEAPTPAPPTPSPPTPAPTPAPPTPAPPTPPPAASSIVCDSVKDAGVDLGALRQNSWGLAISKGSQYAYSGVRDSTGQILRYDLSNVAAGGTEVGRTNAQSRCGVLTPDGTKLYWGGRSTKVYECDAAPGGSGCTTLKYADGSEFDLAVYGSNAQGHAFYMSPSDPDKLWMAPHTDSFGYFELSTQTNHIVSSDLGITRGLGMIMSDDGAKMFVGGPGGIAEYTFKTNSVRSVTSTKTLDLWFFPDENGKKVLWNGWGWGANVKLTCYENCDTMGETVRTLSMKNDNYAGWSPDGDKFYMMQGGRLKQYDGVNCATSTA